VSYRLNLDPPRPRLHQVATHLPTQEAKALDEYARARGLSISKTVRAVLREAGVLGEHEARP
jgi:ribbon-helix-helix CopG family protein